VIFLVTFLQAMLALLSPTKGAVKKMDEEDTVNKTKDTDNKAESTVKASTETAAVGEKSEEESTDKADEEDAETKDMESKDENADKESKEQTATVGEKSLHRFAWEIHHRFLVLACLPQRGGSSTVDGSFTKRKSEERTWARSSWALPAVLAGPLSSSMSYRRCGLTPTH
jgi:hypothetical protein